MKLIQALKILMVALLMALFFSLLGYTALVKVAMGNDGNVGFGYEWIASFQDGDVNVYSIKNTSCFVVVGELHGKTVGIHCP